MFVSRLAIGLIPVLSAPAAVDYVRDIEPILHERCYLCHGAQQQMSDLRLDSREAALKGGASGVVIVPGDSAASKLVARISSSEDGFRMPPGGEALSAQQASLISEWIAAGAVWPDSHSGPEARASARESAAESHWAFQPVRRPDPPTVNAEQWVRNPIDRFVLAKLEAEGLAPSLEAAPETLRRRVHLDLVGLPPSSLGGANGGDTPATYEAVVDGLLRSQHFGERWALPWLDLARYADSEGYERDPLRPHAWRWRHWVIESINRDMPFDQFTIEQIAGDLLPQATTEQRVATGFLRNGIKNREAGTKNAQKRFEETVDRVNTVANTWLGLTVGCAQCHDH
ncbi:MAG: DUF1549 domain-containing protein, partial [Acidobacteria bacterium]|nr:DUF1549 domain-containing protein [Acidobacteriota bacterium]